MGALLGLDAVLYRNDGTYEAPDLVSVDNCRDLTLNLEKGEADVTTRGNNGWRATLGTLKDGSLEFEMVWDTADANFTAIRSAWFSNTPIEFFVLSASVDAPESEGLRATFAVLSFTKSEPLEEAQTVSVTIKPTYSAHPPEWVDGTDFADE